VRSTGTGERRARPFRAGPRPRSDKIAGWIERDLHDGVQQRLVSLALDQRQAEAIVPAELPGLRAQLSRVTDGLADVMEELQEISRGIHPAILAQGGLATALKTLRDDGRGGADPSRGSGLIGLTDRVDALGGTIEVASPSGKGTTLLITLPIEES
jgi:signal transduction histidine kinase